MGPQILATAGGILVVVITAGVGIWRYYSEKDAERRCISAALLAEIHRLHRNVIPRHYQWWTRGRQPGDEELPLISFTTPIYDEHSKNLGQLDENITDQPSETTAES